MSASSEPEPYTLNSMQSSLVNVPQAASEEEASQNIESDSSFAHKAHGQLTPDGTLSDLTMPIGAEALTSMG